MKLPLYYTIDPLSKTLPLQPIPHEIKTDLPSLPSRSTSTMWVPISIANISANTSIPARQAGKTVRSILRVGL